MKTLPLGFVGALLSALTSLAASTADRLPGWAASHELFRGEKRLAGVKIDHGYAVLAQTWKAGETVTLKLPMQPRLIAANPNIEETRNQVAVMRGPLVYCLESADLPAGVEVPAVYVPSDVKLQAAAGLPGFEGKLGAAVVTLSGEGLYRAEPAWAGLYRTLEQTPMKPVPLRFVPYYTWANRGRSAMSVWLPVVLKP